METKPLTGWLTSISGLTTVVIGLSAQIGVICAGATDQITKITNIFGVEKSSPINIVLPVILAILVTWYVWRSFKRFLTASRVRSDAFNLMPNNPQSLIGRTSDDPNKDSIRILLNLVKTNSLILLDGESGCGKSALVKTGLIPVLKDEKDHGLLAVLLLDWGGNWVRGPLIATLGALHRALSSEQRAQIDWKQPPKLIGETEALIAELAKRLTQIPELGLNLLLIADQFDDYQGQNRHKFVDLQGSWLTPERLVEINPYWQLISQALISQTLRLLVITRNDSVAGISCIDFVTPDLKRSHTLQRVESRYLHQLLLDIAPDDAIPPVVSNPQNGWHQLREFLERDLKAQGDILMQQVRTVLLGLKYLPALTPSEYKNHGKLRGLETLVITKALASASENNEKKLVKARDLLRQLVLKGVGNQKSKSRSESFKTLALIVGDETQTKIILSSLQTDQIVRSYVLDDCEAGWQLDHDYLAEAVLADYCQANRWSTELLERSKSFNQSDNGFLQRWNALLPTYAFFSMLWEKICGRLPPDLDRHYFMLSGVKQIFLMGCLIFVGYAAFWSYQDIELTKRAEVLVNQIVVPDDHTGTLQVWLAKQPLRERVLRIMAQKNIGQLNIAVGNNWHLAQGGNSSKKNKQVASILFMGLNNAIKQKYPARENISEAYIKILPFIDDQKYLAEAASKLRELLIQVNTNKDTEIVDSRDDMITSSDINVYISLIAKIADQENLKIEVDALKHQMETTNDRMAIFAPAYSALLTKLADQQELISGAVALRQYIEIANIDNPEIFVKACSEIITNLTDQQELKNWAVALRTRMQMADSNLVIYFDKAYSEVITKLANQKELKNEAVALREQIEAVDITRASIFATTYFDVITKLNKDELKNEIQSLREQMTVTNVDISAIYARVYSDLVATITDEQELNDGAVALRTLIGSMNVKHLIPFAEAYSTVVARINNQQELKLGAATLREKLALVMKKKQRTVKIISAESFATGLVESYVKVAIMLTDEQELNNEVANLRAQIISTDIEFPSVFATAYAAVIKKLTDPRKLREEAAALRVMIESDIESNVTLASAYASVIEKLNDQHELKNGAAVLRMHITSDIRRPVDFAKAYTTVVRKLSDQRELKSGAISLRAQLVLALREKNVINNIKILGASTFSSSYTAAQLVNAYLDVVEKITDQNELKNEAEALRAHIDVEDIKHPELLVKAYIGIITMLTNQQQLKSEAIALREQMESVDSNRVSRLADLYTAVLTKITDQQNLKMEAIALRSQIKIGDVERSIIFATAYAEVIATVNDQEELKNEAYALRVQMEIADTNRVAAFAMAYIEVAMILADKEELKSGAAAMQRQIKSTDIDRAVLFSEAFAAIAKKINTQKELANGIAALHGQLEIADIDHMAVFAGAYAEIITNITDQKILNAEAIALRTQMEITNTNRSMSFAEIYAQIISKIIDKKVLKIEAAALRAQIEIADIERAAIFAETYSQVVSKFADQNELMSGTTSLRKILQSGHESVYREKIFSAYNRVVEQLFKKLDGPAKTQQIKEILTLSGHPFFGSEITLTILRPNGFTTPAEAVNYAKERYQFDSESLWPANLAELNIEIDKKSETL